jgi:hypothetical protein
LCHLPFLFLRVRFLISNKDYQQQYCDYPPQKDHIPIVHHE